MSIEIEILSAFIRVYQQPDQENVTRSNYFDATRRSSSRAANASTALR